MIGVERCICNSTVIDGRNSLQYELATNVPDHRQFYDVGLRSCSELPPEGHCAHDGTPFRSHHLMPGSTAFKPSGL